jgi:hypothetical protein
LVVMVFAAQRRPVAGFRQQIMSTRGPEPRAGVKARAAQRSGLGLDAEHGSGSPSKEGAAKASNQAAPGRARPLGARRPKKSAEWERGACKKPVKPGSRPWPTSSRSEDAPDEET